VPIVSATATGDHDDRVDARPRRHRLPAGLLRLASDERLVALLRDGSEPAFEALYARHHRGVLSFCRHMLGSPEEAEDALQHTFLSAYGDIMGSRKEIHLRPWLYAIARNRCLTVLRARREGVVADVVEPSTEHLSVEVERRHELRALLGDLAGLPDDQRAALVLAELGDMSHDEIGQTLGCPREKVKALVFQARSSLIASREAREASCDQIREQVANLRGSALRRNLLRRHVRECAGCREFHDQVRAQRRELALILPVAPSLGLQAAVLGAGGAAVTSSVVAKTAVVLAVAGTGVAAVETVREQPAERPARSAPAAPRSAVAAPVAAPKTEYVGATTARPGDDAQGGDDRSSRDDVRRADRDSARRGDDRRARYEARRGHDRAPGAARGHERQVAPERGRSTEPGRGHDPLRAPNGNGAGKEKQVKTPKVVKAKPSKPAKPVKVKPTKPPKAENVPPPQAEAVPKVEKLPKADKSG
jgi:RNA polymerase sigma factor (sigma-70 family)